MSDHLESSEGGRFWPGFRQEAVDCLRQWLDRRVSGSLVGLPGAGKSNLLHYIAQYPEQLHSQERDPFVVLVPLDLNHLIDGQPATLYRLILRACFHLRFRFPEAVANLIEQQYETHKGTTDFFMTQTAVYDLLVAVAHQKGQIVLILDQFDRFCRTASPELTLSLRALRDSFKATLTYIVGMRQAAIYLPEPEVLGELYPLIDTHICWVGAMTLRDSHSFIVQELSRAGQSVNIAEIERLFVLTGGYAAVLKAACAWLARLPERQSPDKWLPLLRQQLTIQSRLADIWQVLTQEEQWLLAQLPSSVDLGEKSQEVLLRLGYRGVCQQTEQGWQIRGSLLQDFVQTAVQQGLGRIWQDERSGDLYQGKQRLVGLRPLEEALLTFLIHHPYKPHSKTDLIQQVWPDGTQRAGVTDDSLYQAVRGVRQKIEPEPTKPPVYLITKRGVDEGGYQFFPEGNPAH